MKNKNKPYYNVLEYLRLTVPCLISVLLDGTKKEQLEGRRNFFNRNIYHLQRNQLLYEKKSNFLLAPSQENFMKCT